MTKLEQIQQIIGTKVDNIWGPKSEAALRHIILGDDVHVVKASSFADPADIAAFKKCKAKGNSDKYCFRFGDNGIGTPALGGKDTTVKKPMCALPPEDWKPLGTAAPGAKVRVTVKGKSVICELRDTMPARKNIKNGAGIDLNYAAVKALGLKTPLMVDATWQYV
jgi:hypothetical protein